MIQLTKRLALLMSVLMIFGLMPILPANNNYATVATLPGARSEMVSGDLYLGGDYIEVGIDNNGWFGTVGTNAPAGFHPAGSRTQIGMVMDADGFNIGDSPTTGDFFLPGSPMEGFGVGYKTTDGGSSTLVNNVNSTNGFSQNKSLENLSTGDNLKAIHTSDNGSIKLEQTISFNKNNKYFKVEVVMTNITSSTLYDVRYFRMLDPEPDYDLHSTFNTKNRVVSNPPGDSKAVVYAKGPTSNVPFSYISFDSTARGSVNLSYPTDPYNATVYNVDGSAMLTSESAAESKFLSMTFAKGNLAAGQSTTMVFYNSLDPNLEDSLSDIENETPTNQAYLEDLTIQNGTLSPSFTTGGALYTTVLPVGTTTANITPTASGSSITINGSAVTSTSTAAINVTPGHNAVRVEVTSGSAVKTVDLDIVVASNLLSALTLGSGTLTPTFDSGTTAYTVSYPVATTGTTVAATTLTTGASVTINGTATSSAAITLSAGTNTINVVVTAEDSTTKTYTITATVASPVSNEGNGTTTPSTPTATPTTNPGADVIVNGIKASAGTENITVVGGRLVKELVVNSKTIDTMIDQALKAISDAKANNTTVTTTNIVRIPVTNTTSDIITVKLTGDIVKRLDDNKFSINIETNKGNFILPAQEMKISEIAKNFNLATDLQKIVVDVQINVSLPAVTEMLNNAVKANGNMVVVSQPLEFKITASSSETKETVEISKFTSYVEREVLLPSTVDMTKITTGVLIEPNGQLRHIPTKVFTLNNNNYANIQSLTNSDYSVVYNPVKVASVEGHWAQTAVNDLASRLIISEPAKFEPNAKITRGEFATMLTKALGLYRTEGPKLTFKDVKDTDPNAVGIAFAAEYKLISGYSDGNFKPNQQISRQEAMVIFAKAMTLVGIQQDAKAKLAPYADASQVASWAKDAATTVTNANVMSGIGANKLGPKMTFTAAEAAYAVRNMLVSGDMINK